MTSEQNHELHRRITALRIQKRRCDHRMARLLYRMERCEGYRELGYTSMKEYGAVEHDMTQRFTTELLRIGRALPDLPTLDQVFGQGRLGWTKVREVPRVATPETDSAWTDRALQLNSRQLEQLVSAAVVGEAPPAPGELPKKPSRKRMVWSADAADAQVIQDALALAAQQRSEDGHQVDKAVLLAAICREWMERQQSQDAPSGTRYRTLVQTCDRCQQQTGPIHELSEVVRGEAACDSEIINLRPEPDQGRLQRRVPPTVRRTVLHRQGRGCAVPGCCNRRWVDVHHVLPRSQAGTRALENLIALCGTSSPGASGRSGHRVGRARAARGAASHWASQPSAAVKPGRPPGRARGCDVCPTGVGG